MSIQMDLQDSEISNCSKAVRAEEQENQENMDVQSSASDGVPKTSSPSQEISCHSLLTDAPATAQVTRQVEGESNVAPLVIAEEAAKDCSGRDVLSCNENSTGIESGVLLGKRKLVNRNEENTEKVNIAIKTEANDFTGDDYYNHSCFFCKAPFLSGLKVMHIVLSQSLPCSSLDPLSLLQCFGIQIPFASQVDSTGFSPVDVCAVCYILISDCDLLYPHLNSVISKVLDVWPEKLKGIKTLSLNVSFPENEGGDVKVAPRGKLTSLSPFVSKKRRGNQRGNRKKVFLSDVEFAFTYTKKSYSQSKIPDEVNNSSEFGDCAYRVRETDVFNKVSISEVFTCGFCGMAFVSEKEWSSHSMSVHKIVQKWLFYHLQTILKRSIGKEVGRHDNTKPKSDKRQRRELGEDVRKCYACDGDFQSKAELLDHLHDFHIMVLEICDIDKLDGMYDPPQVQCKTELVELDEDRMSNGYSDCSENGAIAKNKVDVKNNIRISASKAKSKENFKSTVNVAKDHSNEVNVKKVYAPHWRCRICGMLFSSQNVLTKHKHQAHPESSRIIKRKFYRDSSPESVEESSLKMENNVDSSRRRARSDKGYSEPNEELGYCVVLKGDGQGGVIDHRVKLDDDAEKDEAHQIPIQHPKPKMKATEQDDKSVTCGMCGEEFGSHILIAEHSCPGYENVDKSASDEVVLLECKVCNRRLQGVNSMRTHMARSHGYPYKKRVRKHQCKICTFKTQVRSQFLEHMKEKHNTNIEPPAKCLECGKMYSAQYIARHIAIIHGSSDNKKYSCKFCTMKYHDLNYLKRHIYFDHANTKWKCQVCEAEFDKYHRLQQHRVNAHGTEVHKCFDCEKTFKRKGDLTAHIKRSHLAKVPSVCTFCSKAYIEPSNLRTHLMKKHGVPWENTLSDRYARHQQESKCLRRRAVKDTKQSKGNRKNEDCIQIKQTQHVQNKIFCQYKSEENEYEESFEQSDQQDEIGLSHPQHNTLVEGTTLRETVVTSHVSSDISEVKEAHYNVIEISETSGHVAKVEQIAGTGTSSYIIIEEAPN